MNMSSKIVIGVLAVAVLGVGFFLVMSNVLKAPADSGIVTPPADQMPMPPASNDGNNGPAGGGGLNVTIPAQGEDSVRKEPVGVPAKEFSMTAYYDAEGKHFSLKEINVKKGDLVRVKVTNTKGMHDFSLDEYGIRQNLPLNQEVVVEFTADKTGEFIYYCSMPGHRAGGQWGTLRVTE